MRCAGNSACKHCYFEKLSSIVRVDEVMCLCVSGRAGPGRARAWVRRAGPGLGPEYVGTGRASGLSTSGRAGPRAWVRRAGPGLGPEYVGPGRASGLSTSGRAGPRAWIEEFGPGSGLEFRPVATSTSTSIISSYIWVWTNISMAKMCASMRRTIY